MGGVIKKKQNQSILQTLDILLLNTDHFHVIKFFIQEQFEHLYNKELMHHTYKYIGGWGNVKEMSLIIILCYRYTLF